MKSIKSFIFLFLFFLFVNPENIFSQPSLFSYENYVNVKGDTLKYRMLFPDADKMRKFPLVIFLHGAGERGDDNDAQLKWGVMNFASDANMSAYPAFVIAPQCPKGMEWASFKRDPNSTMLTINSTPSKPMQLLIELIHKFVKDFSVDTNRIYITGSSMGGYGTYDAIMRNPTLFAAAVPVCGGGDTTQAKLIAHIPIWIFHGAEDPAVNPLYSLDMLTALTKAGAHPGFTQYPEVGHFSWIRAYNDPLMITWIFRQHK